MRGGCLAACLAVLAFLAASPLRAHEHEWDELALERAPTGVAAPDFAVLDLDGRRRGLPELRGTLVVLNFWATWCAPCAMEMPALERLHRRVGAGVQVLTINFRESPERVRAFAQEAGLTLPLLLDSDGRVAARYAVDRLPFTVLVDQAGQVRAVAEGPRAWDSAAAISLLTRLGAVPGF